MPLKSPQPEKVVLPFRNRRAEVEAERRRQNELFIGRSLDSADGFSWSHHQVAPEGLAARYRAIPLHRKLFALLAVVVAVVIVTAFVAASGSGVKPQPLLVYAESWSGDRSAADAQRERNAEVAELRAQVAQQKAAMAAYEARVAADRAAAAKAAVKQGATG